MRGPDGATTEVPIELGPLSLISSFLEKSIFI